MKQNFRQKTMKLFYPLIMSFGKLFGAKANVKTNFIIKPTIKIPLESIKLNNGKDIEISKIVGKKVLLVNTASDCGYTGQYETLQKIHETYDDVVVIGFPANNFKEQEKKSDSDIESFCKINYGVSFWLSKKVDVIGTNKDPIFEWLSNPKKNGWCSLEPEWNFSKYIVDENGMLCGYFGPGVDPLDKRITDILDNTHLA